MESKAMREQISFRNAVISDLGDLKHLIFTHGPNEWNHLPREEVEAHLDVIITGETQAVIALDGRRLVGMVTFNIGDFYPEYESERCSGRRGYIAEAVVHSAYAGQGIGSVLLEKAKNILHCSGVDTIYAKRHEENLASAGMMRKAGFVIVDTFPDPIRNSGSGKTTVERFQFKVEEG